MAKVCKSGGEGTFAERHGNGKVAPIPDTFAASPPKPERFDPKAVGRYVARINSGVLCTLTPPEQPVGF
jgi:hypothetical protein